MWRRWLYVILSASPVIGVIAGAEIFSLASESYPQRHAYSHNQYQPVYALLVELLLGAWQWLRDRIDHDTIISAAIVATAVFTGTLWAATRKLGSIASTQASDMQSLLSAAQDTAAASASQVNAIEAQERVMREQAETMAASLDFTKRAADAAQASANAANTHAVAAEEANRINRDLLIATQRPWVSARLTIAGDLIYRDDGAAVLPITCTLKNIGRTPATSVWPRIRGVLQGPAGKNNVGLQRLFMAEIRQSDDISRQFGHIIFPNQEIPVETAIILLNDEIKASQAAEAEREILQIAVIGFVEYQFTFPDQPRETGFIYMVLAEHPRLQRMTFTIFRDLGDIPRDKLDIRPSWVDAAGFFAT
jgi:hypothetical protein